MSNVVTVAKTVEEYERIFRFRYSIYVEEMGKPMPDADHRRRILYDDLDDRSTHLYAQRETEIVGAIRIIWGADGLPAKYVNWYGLNRFSSIPKEEISFTGRLMVSGKQRNSAVSMVLSRQAYCLGRERGIGFDFIHTTTNLVPFFERLGHRPYTSEFLDPDLGSRMPMVLALGDLAHLRACQSPFASLAVSLNHHRPERVAWNATLQAIFREVFLAIYWYQKHTTEAGFHMLGRLPGNEEKLLKLLMLHKIEEAGHNEWAFRDYQLLGGSVEFANSTPMQPACYAVTGVWWRMAITENPFGYLGAEYLFEYLTMRVAQDLVPLFKQRGFKADGLKFIIDHATEDEKHAVLIRHLISDSVTRYPETDAVMIRCFDYFRQVYPLPVWQEAYHRAVGQMKT